MHTSSEQTRKTSTTVIRQTGIPFFARKHDMTFFQGNRQAFSSASFIQPKLAVSQPEDPQEKEADQMADRVMTMPDTQVSSAPAEKEEEIQRQEEEEPVQRTASEEIRKPDDREKDEHVSRKIIPGDGRVLVARSGRSPPGPAKSSFEHSLSSARGTGSPLPGETRSFMESRFNADFSGVRIHTGELSVQMNREINSQAFTYGNDIFFNSGKYSTGTPEGQSLIAHELTHTIQQGASSHISPKNTGRQKNITVAARNNNAHSTHSTHSTLHRSAANMTAAVSIAKGEAGKVIANKEGPDGFRVGWPRLMEYFRTALGPEKILPEGQTGDSTDVSESQIRKFFKADNVDVVTPDNRVIKGTRDALPSWCGIFAFWSLNKAGLPMKKWTLGRMTIPPEAAFSPGTTPPPGAIAYRKERSHYGLVEKSDGVSVTTINGNTAGDDHLGGEVQVQTHPLSGWMAFIDPMKLIEGTVRNPDFGVEERQLSLSDLRKELFGVQRKEQSDETGKKDQENSVQSHPAPSVQAKKTEDTENREEIERKEEKREDGESKLQTKMLIHDTGGSAVNVVQQRSEPKVQRGIFSAIRGAINSAVEWAGDRLEEGKKWLLGKIRNLIMKVPGYKALRVVLGEDPITGEHVERNGKNFIDAALDIMPFGEQLKEKMQELGILEKAEQFVDKTIGRVKNLVNGIFDVFSNFWNSLSLSDIRNVSGVFSRLENAFTSFFEQIKSFASGVAGDFLEFIKKALLIPLGNYIKTRTRFWDLLCLIMGKDPLTDEPRPFTGANVLNAFLNLSEWGIEQRKKMQETGTFNKIAAWIDKGIAVFSKSYDELKAAFRGLWDYVNIQSLMHPVETFRKIFDSFWRPVERVGSFVIETGITILKIVKEVLFKRISNEAKGRKGFYLITVLIGKDPFTGEKVDRTTENIIKGFMLLTEGGEEQFNKMKESGAIDKATQKIDAAVKTLGFSWSYVKGLFINLWNSFTWKDLLVPLLAFAKIINTFKDPVLRLIRFVITVMTALFEIILRLMGFPVDLVIKLIDNVVKAWNSIRANPSGFFMNVLRAIKQGFIQFFDNILTHLWNGLKAWLRQELADAGVPIPTDFSVTGIIKWLLVVLDITMEKIWKKLEARIGKEKVDKIRRLIDKAEALYDKANEALVFIEDVRQRGMGAVVDRIKEKLTNIWDLVLGAVRGFIMDQIIRKVTAKLLSMLDPTGIMAVVNSAIALYKAIPSFIKYLARLLEIVNSFVEGIIEICAGNIAVAANFLERSLANGIPVVIGFLANQVGLDLSGRIRDVLAKVREKVDQGLDFLIDKLVGFAEKLVEKAKSAKEKLLNWLGLRKPVKTKDEISHTIYIAGSAASATLMIATTPMTVKNYLLTEVKDKHNLKDSDIQIPLQTAENIDKLIKASEPDEAKKTTGINMQLTKLAEEIASLPLTSAGTNSEIMYGQKYHEHGSSAFVAFRQAPFPSGSAPMSSSTKTLSKMNIRKQGGSPYYIKGHLLNENLGGPGNIWENLTPLSSKANSDHKLNFENPVKMAVNGKLSGNSTKPLGYMKGFSVVANYGRTEPSSQTMLKDESASDFPPGFDESNWDINEVIEILDNEMYAPTTLECKATIRKDASSPEENISYTVNNDISHGDLKEYQLGLAPKVSIKLADLIKNNPEATSDKEMAKTFSGIKGIGEARAGKIYDTFKKKGKITNGKADIGIGLVALNRQNKGKIITSGEFSGPWI